LPQISGAQQRSDDRTHTEVGDRRHHQADGESHFLLFLLPPTVEQQQGGFVEFAVVEPVLVLSFGSGQLLFETLSHANFTVGMDERRATVVHLSSECFPLRIKCRLLGGEHQLVPLGVDEAVKVKCLGRSRLTPDFDELGSLAHELGVSRIEHRFRLKCFGQTTPSLIPRDGADFAKRGEM
jgi:hypothetical protein